MTSSSPPHPSILSNASLILSTLPVFSSLLPTQLVHIDSSVQSVDIIVPATWRLPWADITCLSLTCCDTVSLSRPCTFLWSSASHTRGCESTVVRGKAPLDPPYPPPSGQDGLSRPERAKDRASENFTLVLFFRFHALTWGLQLLATSLERDTSAMGSSVCVSVYGNGLLHANVCVFVWSL